MKKDIVITVDTLTSMVYKDTATMGIVKENIESNIIFKFNNGFVDGVAWLEFDDGVNKGYLAMQKVDETYVLPIKSSLLHQKGKINLQLRVTQDENVNGIPVYKSNIFYMNILDALNTTTEIPDDYPSWIEVADAKINEIDSALAEVDNLNIEASKTDNVTTIVITDKEGVEHTTTVLDGVDGQPGRDGQDGQPGASNTLTIGTVEKGENAEATITGTSPNQTLNLVLPKGDKGDSGASGRDGVDGVSPVASVSKSGSTATITITDRNGTTTATVSDGQNGTNGRDGYVQYTAGENITIENNVISATGGGSAGNVDGVTTRLNTDDEIEVMGIYTEQNSARKIWEGTSQQYSQLQTIDSDTYYYITDDNISPNEVPNGGTTGQVLGKASNTDNDTIWLDKRSLVQVTTDSGTTYTISSLAGNQSYKLGTLTSLTISAVTIFDEESIIYFTSGSTPTSITIPTTLVNIGDVPELTSGSGTCTASKSYIISVLNNIAVWKEY